MEFTSPIKLIVRYLSIEKNFRLNKKESCKVKYFNYGESVVHVNSTYLETVDKFYKQKGIDNGWWVIVSLAVLVAMLIGVGRGIQLIPSDGYTPLLRVLLPVLFCICILIFTGRIVLKEWFKWTHYPIRFNRKNQTVYVFRTNGTVLSVPWKEVYFTQDKDPGPLQDWCIRGHILDKDGETVLETFSLGICENKESLPGYWEFVRRYMEEGPESVAHVVNFCLPIAGRREGYRFGLLYLLSNFNGAPMFLFPLLFVLSFIFSIPRYIAMVTSKVPVWPESIEAQCAAEEGDPYAVDASINPEHPWRDLFRKDEKKE